MSARGPDDVVLVVPPFVSVLRPALGVSTLKSALRERGIASRVEYVNLEFADRIGARLFEQLAEYTSVFLIGEWIFARALFGRDRARDGAIFEDRLSRHLHPTARERIYAARDGAAVFLEECAERIVRSGPAVVGLSTSFQQNCAALALGKAIKAVAPETVVCLGGANCEGPMGQGLLEAFPWIDYVFSGESERSFPDLCERLLAGEPVEGGRFRDPTTSSGLVKDLDELPVPDFADYFSRLESVSFRDAVEPGLVFEGSRGCWWGAKHHCRFCGLNGSTLAYRAKSPARVHDEVQRLASTYGVTRFEAVDNILDHRAGLETLDRIAEQGQPYRLFFEIKANLDEEGTRRLARGGVTWVQPGIESLDDDRLRAMEKGVTALQNIRLLRNCRSLGIRPMWALLHGFPGDRAEQYERMADLAPQLEHLEPPMGMQPVRLDRFSPWFERADELGFEQVQPMDSYFGVYALPEEVISKIAYFFAGEPTDAPDPDTFSGLQRAVGVWQTRGYAPGRPRLVLERDESGGVIVDTRACARAPRLRYDREDLAVLDAFTAPSDVDGRLASLARDGWTGCRSSFESLVEAALLVRVEGRAVHVVTEADPDTHADQEYDRFPGGRLRGNENEPLFGR